MPKIPSSYPPTSFQVMWIISKLKFLHFKTYKLMYTASFYLTFYLSLFFKLKAFNLALHPPLFLFRLKTFTVKGFNKFLGSIFSWWLIIVFDFKILNRRVCAWNGCLKNNTGKLIFLVFFFFFVFLEFTVFY